MTLGDLRATLLSASWRELRLILDVVDEACRDRAGRDFSGYVEAGMHGVKAALAAAEAQAAGRPISARPPP